jgi:hypothetical protein
MTGFAPRASFRRQRFYRTNRGALLTENTCEWLRAIAAGMFFAVLLIELFIEFPLIFSPH